jgi:hypothetical protein
MSPLAQDLVGGGGAVLLRIFVVLVPIVAALDLLKSYGVLARLRRPLAPALRWLGLEPASADPFVAGIVFGLVYGAGVILARLREEGLPRRQVELLAGLICMGHALPEDTLLFVALGANGWLVAGVRLLLVAAVVAGARAGPGGRGRRRAPAAAGGAENRTAAGAAAASP